MTLILYGELAQKEILLLEYDYYILGERPIVRFHLNVEDIIYNRKNELLI